MLKEYMQLIRFTVGISCLLLSAYCGYTYSTYKHDLKISNEIIVLQEKIAQLNEKKVTVENEIKYEHTDADNKDSSEIVALRTTIATHVTNNARLRAEIDKYKKLSESYTNTGVNREFATIATSAVMYAELFGRANETAGELAIVATEAHRRGKLCEVKYDAAYIKLKAAENLYQF